MPAWAFSTPLAAAVYQYFCASMRAAKARPWEARYCSASGPVRIWIAFQASSLCWVVLAMPKPEPAVTVMLPAEPAGTGARPMVNFAELSSAARRQQGGDLVLGDEVDIVLEGRRELRVGDVEIAILQVGRAGRRDPRDHLVDAADAEAVLLVVRERLGVFPEVGLGPAFLGRRNVLLLEHVGVVVHQQRPEIIRQGQ